MERVQTLSERFIEEKRNQWLQLRKILLKIRKGSYPSLTGKEVEEFASLYRLVCTDLGRARTLKLSPDIIEYLNNIVGQAHKFLYSFKPVRRSDLELFFSDVLPGVIRHHGRFLILAALLLFIPLITTLIICWLDPDKASLLLPSELLTQMEESYKTGIEGSRRLTISTFALSFYIQHNITIAFLSFAGGVLAGLGTIYFLVYNGITLGAISGYIIGLGYGEHFLSFITAHSVMEFSGMVTAGAAGLLLGNTIIKASRFYKKDQLARQKNPIFYLVTAATLMFACAALIEGVISPQPLTYALKFLIATASLAFLVYYFGFKARQLEKKHLNNRTDDRN